MLSVHPQFDHVCRCDFQRGVNIDVFNCSHDITFKFIPWNLNIPAIQYPPITHLKIHTHTVSSAFLKFYLYFTSSGIYVWCIFRFKAPSRVSSSCSSVTLSWHFSFPESWSYKFLMVWVIIIKFNSAQLIRPHKCITDEQVINSKSKIMLKMHLRTEVLNAFSNNLFAVLECSSVSSLLLCIRPRVWPPTLSKAGVRTLKPSTQEVESRGSETKGHPQLQGQLKASLGYIKQWRGARWLRALPALPEN